MGIVFVFFGVSLIGFSNIDEKKSITALNPTLGNALCICA